MSCDKIGLLTFHDTLNYGSLLQTYSTYRAIEEIGENVVLLDYRCAELADREAIKPLRSCKSVSDFVKGILWNPSKKKKHRQFWNFIKTHMNLTQTYYIDTISEANDISERFVVGSDIVWK